jgi:hypothetical protein
MAKERPPALLVMAVANCVAMYVAVVVKSNHLHPPLPLWMSISQAVSVWKRKEVSRGRAAAQQRRLLMS